MSVIKQYQCNLCQDVLDAKNSDSVGVINRDGRVLFVHVASSCSHLCPRCVRGVVAQAARPAPVVGPE